MFSQTQGQFYFILLPSVVPEKLSLKKDVTFHVNEGAKCGSLEEKLPDRPFETSGSAKSAALAAAENLCSIGIYRVF